MEIPQTAEQLNRPITGQHDFIPAHVEKALLRFGSGERFLKRYDDLQFALERIVNLLEHADPMMALKVAREALKKE